ncbi:AMP-binding protein [Nocardia donostiensis]|uniref:AMP-dependent synthetase n=1 Tax=Nocardia donostiensis TaxID=1538463 RepID=A0A1W0AXB4_9NOCA|nr:AMP-binding protein [Nocardia donostiensis]ONM49351.1 AMP-dependent synthetase [Nocardia donostiensis]OQS14871.1 AMP-dependent synthetase [Nocardia donostiensis]OQS21874.1 AMP-dependent synthetase [Nocardia donostiensis]
MVADLNARVRALLDRYDGPEACAAQLLCDGHPADAVACTIIEADLSSTDLTYGELREKSARFAAALAELGVGRGDRVATLMGKSADLVVALLAIWRRGAVHVPLFTAFAPPAIAFRLGAAAASVVIADAGQAAKLSPGDDIPVDAPWQVIVAGGEPAAGQLAMSALLTAHQADDPRAEPVPVGGDGLLVQLFTSGTTGTPKGVPIPLRALASFHAYQEFALDVRPDDVFWNAADPGWAYGLYYAILGPLAAGTRSLLLHAGFSPALTWQVLQRFGVTNFAAAPTVYRALRAEGSAPAEVRLRRASSAGEPLTPEVVAWSAETLGVAVRDHYGQTEHGMVICNAWHDQLSAETPAGSMGRALPGWACAVLSDDADTVAPTGEMGRIAIDTEQSPLLWFLGYLDAPERTAQRYTADGRWYLTGDAGSQDAEGFFHFSSRDDDVIIMAGYRIGPFEVESVLLLDEQVAEAAVVGVPDELRGEVLEAFVVPRDGSGDTELAERLQTLVKKKFAAHAYPRRVHFVDSLPKTPSGKVQRYLLRQEAAE